MYSVGKVKFFDYRPGKGFGFIVDPYDSSDIFFHWRRGGYFQFDGSDNPLELHTQDNLTAPIGDTELVYSFDTGPKGKRVIFWGHRENFNRVENLIENRAIMRLIHRVGAPTVENLMQVDYETVWEGNDLLELLGSFPIDILPIIGGPTEEEETYFEIYTDDSWDRMQEDPRIPGFLREIQRKVFI